MSVARTPAITVVVTVHTRREFLPEALRSAATQSLDRERYEIVVVGPPGPPDEKALFDAANATFVSSVAPGIGGKIVDALPHTRAPLIALLEDDDRFLPEKLRDVVQRFEEDPTLVYLQHGLRPIDRDGRPFTGTFARQRAFRRWERRGRIRLAPGPPRSLGRLRGIPAGFNNSSIVVQRALLIDRRAELARVYLIVDIVLLYLALLSPGALLLDGRPLTELRLHPGSSSHPIQEEVDRQVEALRRYLEANRASREVLVEAASGDPEMRRMVSAQRAMEEVILALRSPGLTRRDAGERLAAVLPYWSTFEVWNRAAALPFAGAYLLAPGLGRRVYREAKRRGY